jgi:hypothetical protein
MTNNRAPLFGSWTAWYLVVFFVLVALIGAFWYLTRRYA